jgi:DNA-binding NarL/FixJ family response regulator
MREADTIRRGRASFERQSWEDAYKLLAEAVRPLPAGPAPPGAPAAPTAAAPDTPAAAAPGAEDLERLAIAAYLTGRDDESADGWARAHHAHLSRGDVPRAVRCAFWLAFGLMQRGDRSRAGGWLARGRRLLDEHPQECAEEGYLLFPAALRSIYAGDNVAASAGFERAAAIGDRFGDADLVALARHGKGRALIRMGRIEEGVALLDEVMVAVEAGEISPVAAGNVYCSVIEACHEIFDLRRAQEWTSALSDWCADQPDLVPYRGQCLVRRAELLQLHGEWSSALDEAQQACDRLCRPPGEPAAGAAFYQQAELYRLRGDFGRADAAYREANKWGRGVQPGLALLRLAQGQIDAAAAAIRRAVEETQERRTRSRLLPAYVEILIAADDVPAARRAAGELSEIAAELDAAMLHAASSQAAGAVLLAEGDAAAALTALRKALAGWQELQAPYEAARVRVSIGRACSALGDAESAEMEIEAARAVFQQLGAAPDLSALDEVARKPLDAGRLGLTAREMQVLRLLASGKTNKSIADDLFISGRTVDRHVSNIFNKLGVSSRAAATASAYEHQLL